MGKKKLCSQEIGAIAIFVILCIVCIVWICVYYCDFEHFTELFDNGHTITVNPTNPFQKEATFQKIGNGMGIDSDAIKTFLDAGGAVSNDNMTSSIINKNEENVEINHQQFRNVTGFIPPSFAFYPFGQASSNYKVYNKNKKLIDEGNLTCMRACADTNCIGVQTEVPELCAFTAVETAEGEKHACGTNSEASCTLYYGDISKADDAYYQLYVQYSGANKNKDFMGQKYYQYGTPQPTPQTGKYPSEATIGWCPATVLKPTEGIYAPKTPGTTCSCTGTGACDDSNCCIYRNLLTTNASKYQQSFYDLVVNGLFNTDSEGVPTAESIFCDTVNHGTGEACGRISDGIYKSCPIERYDPEAEGNQDDTWAFSPTFLNECPYEETEEEKEDAVNKYLEVINDINELNKSSQRDSSYYSRRNSIVNKLMESCYFRKKACNIRGIQPDCTLKSQTDVIRGCWGDPPILNTDSTTNITSCDDRSTIPSKDRCVDNIQDICGLDIEPSFPYGCDQSAGELWKMV